MTSSGDIGVHLAKGSKGPGAGRARRLTATGLEFEPDVAKHIAFPDSEMDAMGIVDGARAIINPIRGRLVEGHERIFGS